MSSAEDRQNEHHHEMKSERELLDITTIFQACSSRCLSFSHPFTPLVENDHYQAGDGVHRGSDVDYDLVKNQSLMEGFHIQGTSIHHKTSHDQELMKSANKNSGAKCVPELDLRDAMTALEIGDYRMDCCEIPLVFPNKNIEVDSGSQNVAYQDESSAKLKKSITYNKKTIPPRIAPNSLTDGTPLRSHSSCKRAATLPHPSTFKYDPDSDFATLLLPLSPCPSLLPYWESLSLSPYSIPSDLDSSSENMATKSPILPLVLLQLSALEAYIGADNGGSNAAETLYCMLWCHDGVLYDMFRKLKQSSERQKSNEFDLFLEDVTETIGINDIMEGEDEDELSVAQWVLYVSTLGTVRIAEAVRWAVVNADIYEEEDFGVTLHGGAAKLASEYSTRNKDKETSGGKVPATCPNAMCKDGIENITIGINVLDDGNIPLNNEERQMLIPSSMRFCPALKQPQFVECVWDDSLARLHRFRLSCHRKGQSSNETNSTIDALETILRLQRGFFTSITLLSDLNDQNVVEFTKLAAKRSRETVQLLDSLKQNNAISKFSSVGLLEKDGRLRKMGDSRLDQLLSASFDPFVNRRWLGNAPVRKATFRPLLDVINSISLLAEELEWAVCNPILYGNTLGRVTRMLESNSIRGCGGPCPPKQPKEVELSPNEPQCNTQHIASMGISILSRSLLVLNLYFDDKLFGQYDFHQMIAQHMRQFCAVPEAMFTSTSPGCGVAWLGRLAKPMYDTLKALCLNRHRERAFTEGILIPAFGSLQNEAAAVDLAFRREHDLDDRTTQSYATNYIICMTLRLMERHIGLGIGLGLYPRWYDLSTAFWYRDFLLSAMINVRGTIAQARMERKRMELQIEIEKEEEERKLRANHKKSGGKKKGKKAPAKSSTMSDVTASAIEALTKSNEEDFEDRLEYTVLTLHRNLCRGLVRYIAFLRQAKLLPDPPASLTMFTTHRRRFEKRFEAFQGLPQPPHLSYEDYVKGSDFSMVNNKDLLSSAVECFRMGKSAIDRLLETILEVDVETFTINTAEKRKDDDLYISIRREEVRAFAKVCVTNSLSLHKLSSIVEKHKSDCEVLLEFSAHKQYCTLTIK